MVIDADIATSVATIYWALQRDRLKLHIITNCCSEDDVLEKTQNVIGLGGRANFQSYQFS
jgi:hypothetical protein